VSVDAARWEHCGADSAIGQAIRQHGRHKCRFEILRKGHYLDICDLEQRLSVFTKLRIRLPTITRLDRMLLRVEHGIWKALAIRHRKES
jgi:hypothetical protein